MDFLKKTNKTVGVIACLLTIFSNFILLSIGTGLLRVEYYYVTQALLPCLVSRIFLIFWCLYFAIGYEYDRAVRNFARYLIPFVILGIVILLIDTAMAYFFLVQSTTTLLVLIMMSNMINQKRFALRSKSYADKLYQLNVLIGFCIFLVIIYIGLSIPIAIRVQPSEYNIMLLVSAMICQLFVIIGIFCVDAAEKKFKQSLEAGAVKKQQVNENGELEQ